MLDNILASKLYRPGSVAYVSRSGGMSNELNNIISRTTDGVYEGVAIGGDRYVFKSTSLTFMHLADAFIQSDLQCIPWELNPQSFVLLTQCSTMSHRNIFNATYDLMRCKLLSCEFKPAGYVPPAGIQALCSWITCWGIRTHPESKWLLCSVRWVSHLWRLQSL